MELTGGERLAAWVSIGLALGVLLISVDLLSGGRLFGWSAMPEVSVAEEAGGDD